MGYAHELGNYAEYSGAPSEDETLKYARTLVDVSASPAHAPLAGATYLPALRILTDLSVKYLCSCASLG